VSRGNARQRLVVTGITAGQGGVKRGCLEKLNGSAPKASLWGSRAHQGSTVQDPPIWLLADLPTRSACDCRPERWAGGDIFGFGRCLSTDVYLKKTREIMVQFYKDRYMESANIIKWYSHTNKHLTDVRGV
jgi:hypothetical protein